MVQNQTGRFPVLCLPVFVHQRVAWTRNRIGYSDTARNSAYKDGLAGTECSLQRYDAGISSLAAALEQQAAEFFSRLFGLLFCACEVAM